ncbi:SurA N-terminal domain-containing protein [Pelagibacteraceae bacterium]|jgi:peptidyl-prolyl cis-trans isomerase D|nr:SurA N-terminal domain-containing protein [Pelagibacteraceae bacterium]MDC1130530.1 SurA N-terminal domain-containing protein [Pelagibacteraceae bacterium]
MANSIGKLSKSFFIKLLVGIIILPFVFWGMGDVFRGGNQNVVATVESKKISTQEFMNYLRQINLNEEQIKNLPKTDLVEQILSQYIGRKVMALEIEKIGVFVNDNALRNIIKNDKLFYKDNKFSRTEYEKFLIKSGITAPQFEANIAEQEKKRQFLSSLAGGIVIPETLIKQEFKKENQTKTIRYIDLEKYHANNKPTEDDIKKLYERNKNIFFIEFKSIQYAEIKPDLVTGNSEYDEAFFKQLDIIENQVLDGKSFNEISKDNNLKIVKIKKINAKKEDQSKNKLNNISDTLFKKIYNIKSSKLPEIINLEGKYYLAEINNIEKKNKLINDPEVQETLNAQLSFKDKIEKNTSIAKDIGLGAYDGNNFKKFADDNGLEIKDYKLSSLKQNDIFEEGLVKRIFLTNDNETNLITNSTLTKTFLILTKKTDYKKLNKSSNDYEKYEAKARLNLINKIYKSYDDSVNQKYKVKLNQKTIDRVKNSF